MRPCRAEPVAQSAAEGGRDGAQGEGGRRADRVHRGVPATGASAWPAALPLAVLSATLLAACNAPAPVYTTETLHLRLPDDLDCRPSGPIESISIHALGDFPPTDGTFEHLDDTSPVFAVDRFPVDTIDLTAEASGPDGFLASGVRTVQVGTTAEASVLLLPYGQSCVLADPLLTEPSGAAVTALPDGGLLIVGGREDIAASRRVVHLTPGGHLSELVGDGLENRREGATATVTGRRVLVAGGAAGDAGPADDTFEVLDATTGAALSVGALCPADATGCTGRRDQGAVALPDGRVLLVGGRPAGGEAPLSSAVLVNPRTGDVDRDVGALPGARIAPATVVLDDGTVLVIGGEDGAGMPTGTVFAFDPDAKTFTSLDDVQVDARIGASPVPLPGGRVAWVGGTAMDGTPMRSLVLWQHVPPFLGGTPAMRSWEVPLDASLPDLDQTRAVDLPDGDVLLTGRDMTTRPRAFVVDPASGAVRETAASRVPTALVSLADGTVAELDATGASLRRESLHTPFDNPPTTVLATDDGGVLAYDADTHWSLSPDGATMVSTDDDARVDLVGLRFADFSLDLDAAASNGGEAELLLVPEGALPVAVRLFGDEVRVGLCSTPRVGMAPLHVERRGDQVTLEAGGAAKTCTVTGITPRVGLAVSARNGTSFRALTGITRLVSP